MRKLRRFTYTHHHGPMSVKRAPASCHTWESGVIPASTVRLCMQRRLLSLSCTERYGSLQPSNRAATVTGPRPRHAEAVQQWRHASLMASLQSITRRRVVAGCFVAGATKRGGQLEHLHSCSTMHQLSSAHFTSTTRIDVTLAPFICMYSQQTVGYPTPLRYILHAARSNYLQWLSERATHLPRQQSVRNSCGINFDYLVGSV